MRIVSLLILALLTSLHATAEIQPTQLLENLKAGKKQTLIAYGTSLTKVGAWVPQVASVLEQLYPGQATVINSAQGGANSNWGAKEFEEKVIKRNPDTVLIEFSVNDAQAKRKTSVEHCQKNLEGMIDRLQAAHPTCEIILQVMNTPAGHTAASRPNLAAYNQMYRDVAKARGLLLIDHFPTWEKLLTDDPARFLEVIPDTIHPIREGALLVSTPVVLKALGIEAGDPSLAEEAPCEKYLSHVMDTDKDKNVSQSEFDAYWKKSFALGDIDKNNLLSPTEFPPASLFTLFDTNEDGQISPEEHNATYRPLFERQN